MAYMVLGAGIIAEKKGTHSSYPSRATFLEIFG